MNKETIIRTIVLAITTINNYVAQLGDVDFGNESLNSVYKVFSLTLNAVAAVLAWWYNNDFTEEACKGTAVTRYLKEVKSTEFVGEDFTEDFIKEGEADE